MTGTCDTEGRISVIIERKMPQGDLATGENERNGAKEADATGSMVLHSLCARRRGLRHHRRSCRCRRRVAQLSDLWQNGYEPLSSTSGFSFAPVSCVESLSRRWRILRPLVTYVRVPRSTSPRFISTSCVKGKWWTMLFARLPETSTCTTARQVEFWNYERRSFLRTSHFRLTLIQLVLCSFTKVERGEE